MKTNAAKIIGAAENFDFLQSLQDAAFVTLVVAFARKSGWNAIKDALLSGKTQLEIVGGLNFEITDPEILSEWLKVPVTTRSGTGAAESRADAPLASRSSTCIRRGYRWTTHIGSF